jgi:agmatine deiminase
MIPDNKTNFLYLADLLPQKYAAFFGQFEKVLNDCQINFQLLPYTKDIWAVDYMPIQTAKDRFVQFVYNPDYLRDTIKWRKTISNVNVICNAINVSTQKSGIVLDGGNVIKTNNKVILCDKIFSENPTYTEKELIKQLKDILQVDKIVFIPTHPQDFTGHADGMVRFYDSDTVLINDYSIEKGDFQLRFRLALHNAGLNYIEIPYNPYNNKKNKQANGIYINYLHMEQAIIIPIFDIKEDEVVIKKFEQLFKGQKIKTINSNDIAMEGGILNCITWNILKTNK